MKGITPVIAVILLLLIVVALVGFAFTFLTSVGTGTEAKVKEQLKQQEIAGNQKIQISSVKSDDTGSTLDVDILSTGTGTIKKDALRVIVKDADQQVISEETNSEPIQPGDSYTIELSSCQPYSTVEITTPGGFTDKKTIVSCENVPPPSSCTENWECTTWSACTNNLRTRTCTDSNSCGTTNNKPDESQSCTSGGSVPTPQMRFTLDSDNEGLTVVQDTEFVTGKYGKAAKFSNGGRMFKADNTVSETSYGVSLWFKTGSKPAGLYSLGDTGHDRHIYVDADGKIISRVWNTDKPEEDFSDIIGTFGTTDYADDQWHHVVVTFDKDTGTKHKLYVDGQLIATGKYTYSTWAQTAIRIGFSDDVKDAKPTLLVDQVRIYDRLLLESEITALFNE